MKKITQTHSLGQEKYALRYNKIEKGIITDITKKERFLNGNPEAKIIKEMTIRIKFERAEYQTFSEEGAKNMLFDTKEEVINNLLSANE